MLRIRLQRSGRKKRPNYRIVVAEHSAPIKGRYADMLGTFDPLIEKHGLVVDTSKVEEWIKKGAKPTNTVARLLKGQGMKGMEPFIIEMKDRKVKNPKEEAAPEVSAAEAPAEEKPAEEAPADDKKTEEPSEKPAEEETKEQDEPAEEAPADAPDETQKKEEDAPAEADKPAEESAPAEEGGDSGEDK